MQLHREVGGRVCDSQVRTHIRGNWREVAGCERANRISFMKNLSEGDQTERTIKDNKASCPHESTRCHYSLKPRRRYLFLCRPVNCHRSTCFIETSCRAGAISETSAPEARNSCACPIQKNVPAIDKEAKI